MESQACASAGQQHEWLPQGITPGTQLLKIAAESGAKFNGVLCGRATWKDGISVYAKQGAKAFEKWLEDDGVKNINNVNEALKAATPWTQRFAM